MIQTGETKSRRKYREEHSIVWHMEDVEKCTSLCAPKSPFYRPTSAGKQLTTKWEYVTCPKCLALKPKEEEEK